jgi:hypothetical protein
LGVWQAEHIFVASTRCFFGEGSGMVTFRFCCSTQSLQRALAPLAWCVDSLKTNQQRNFGVWKAELILAAPTCFSCSGSRERTVLEPTRASPKKRQWEREKKRHLTTVDGVVASLAITDFFWRAFFLTVKKFLFQLLF